jgi:hypothetical protein
MEPGMQWETIETPPGSPVPQVMTVRAQSIPARHAFPEHAHAWHQVVYAITGVLTVAVAGRSFVISPEQAVWLPTGHRHRVGSLLGAEFRSLWIADEAGRGLPADPTVFGVSVLLQALIVEAAAIEGQADGDGYAGRVAGLILDQLRRAAPLPGALPWPREGPLAGLCEALYAVPADSRGPGGVGPGARPVRPDPRPPLRGGARHEPALLAAAPAAVQGDRADGRRDGRDADRDDARLRLDLGLRLRLPQRHGLRPAGLHAREAGGAAGVMWSNLAKDRAVRPAPRTASSLGGFQAMPSNSRHQADRRKKGRHRAGPFGQLDDACAAQRCTITFVPTLARV